MAVCSFPVADISELIGDQFRSVYPVTEVASCAKFD